jgi:hypothetical protein
VRKTQSKDLHRVLKKKQEHDALMKLKKLKDKRLKAEMAAEYLEHHS